MRSKVDTEECRRLLGSEAECMSDADIKVLREVLERTADALFEEMNKHGKEGLDAARWDTHFRLTGEGE